MNALNRKLEAEVLKYLADTLPGEDPLFDGIQILISRDGETAEAPSIHLMVNGLEVTEGFQSTGESEWTSTLNVLFVSSPDDMPPSISARLAGLIECAAGKLADLKESAASDLFIYSMNRTGGDFQVDQETRCHLQTFSFEVKFRGDDGSGDDGED